MHAPLTALPPLHLDVVASALSRLGDWESSVDRPSWSIAGQQLRMEPGAPNQFTVHLDTPEQVLRFQGCQPERSFWLEHLPNIEPDSFKVRRFQQCGAHSWVSQDLETGLLFLRGEACKLRICPICRRVIQRRSAARVLDFMEQHEDQKWQFHTFTLKHSRAPLSNQLNRLVKCFRRLRQRAIWKKNVALGYAVIEVTFHPADSLSPSGRLREHSEWHPHLHVVAGTEWIDWGLLRKAWFSVTGDSDNIDCSLVQSARHAAHYVSKYIGKPPDLSLRSDPRAAADYYRALQHRRLLMPFGATARHRLPPNAPSMGSIQVCRFSHLLTAAAAGNTVARAMLTYIILGTVPRPILPRSSQPSLFSRAPP